MKVKQRIASFAVYVTEHSGLMSSFFSACEDVYIYWLFSLTWKLVILSTICHFSYKKKKYYFPTSVHCFDRKDSRARSIKGDAIHI